MGKLNKMSGTEPSSEMGDGPSLDIELHSDQDHGLYGF